MTEFLGDGAFFLTTVIEEMVRENDAAVRDLNQTFAEMDASAQRFIGTMERHGGALQRVFAGPVTQQLERSAGAVDRYGQSLSELRASIEGAGSRLHELASAATAAEGALRQLPVASAAARDALVSHQREIRQEVNQTTDALTRQAQVAAAMFDPRRELGPTAVAAAGQSFMSRVLPDLGPGPQRALPPYSHGRIFGSRGDAAPGSIANPVVVTIERPEFAGLASRGWPPPGFGGTAGETLAAGQDVGPMVDLLRSIDSQLAQATPQGPSQTVVVYQPSPPAGIPSLTGGAGGGGGIPPVFGGGGGGGGAFPVGGGGGGILPALVAGWYLRQPALQSPPSYPALPRPTQPYFDPSMGRFRDPNTGQIAAGPDERNWRLVGEAIGQALVEVVTKAEYRYVPGTERLGALPPGAPPPLQLPPPPSYYTNRGAAPAPDWMQAARDRQYAYQYAQAMGWPPPAGGGGGDGGGAPPLGPTGGGGDQGGGGFWTAANMMRLFRGDGSKGMRLFGLWGPRIGGGLAGLGSLGSFAGLGLERLLFTGLSVAGSAGAAAAGAGVLAGGALAQMAVGQGSDIAVMKSTIADTKTLAKDLTTVTTNQQLYNDAVKTYGKHSAQAASALSNLHQSQLAFNQQVQAFGGPNAIGVKAEIQLAKNTNALNAFWDAQSQGARVQASNILEQVVRLGHDFVPKVVQAAQQNLSIINQDIKPLFSWLEGPQGMAIWDNLENNFKQSLPTAVHAFTQGIEALLRFLNLASNYTGGFITKIDSLLTRLNSKPDSTFNQWIQKLVSDFQLWAHFIHLIGADLYGLFRNDAGLGNSLIATLNGLLTRIHDYEMSASGRSQIKSIFELHKQEVLSLLHIIESLGSAFAHVYLAVAPQAVSAMNTVVLPVLIALADAIHTISTLSPLAADALGALLIGYKFGGWKTVTSMMGFAIGGLKSVATLFGVIGKEGPVAARSILEVDAAASLGSRAAGAGAARTAASAGSGAMSAAEGAGGAALASGGIGGLLAKLGLADSPVAPFIAEGLGTFLKGGIAAGAGAFGGGMLQHLFGLHTGTASTLGGAGIGALIGSPAGPLGMFMGSLIGGTVGPTIIHFLGGLFSTAAPDLGKKFATRFMEPWHGIVTTSMGHSMNQSIDQAVNHYENAWKNAKQPNLNPLDPAHFRPTTPKDLQKGAEQLGRSYAENFIKGENSVPYQTVTGVISGIKDTLASMPKNAGAAGRATAVEMIVQWAQGLQDKGQLPPHAVQTILTAVRAQFPPLASYLDRWGQGTDQQVATALALKNSRTSLTTTLNQIRKEFGGAKDYIAKTTSPAQLFPNLADAERYLGTIVTGPNGTKATREHALAELQLLQKGSAKLFSEMLTNAGSNTGKMAAAVSSNTSNAFHIGSANFKALATNIANYVGSGAEVTKKGLDNITAQFNAILHSLGMPKNQFLAPVQIAALDPSQLASLVTGQVSPGAVSVPGWYGNPGHAGGGLVQVGQPGQKGMDSVFMPLMVAPGEKVAVFNTNQEPIMNEALRRMGFAGLHGLFNRVNTPNYLGSGGYTGYSLPLPASEMLPGSWSFDQGVDIPAPAGTPEFAIGPGVITSEGAISGFGPNIPVLKLTAGPWSGRSFYYGHAGPDLVPVGAHVRAGQQISEVGSGIVGISTGPHIEFGEWPAIGGAAVAVMLKQLMSGAGVTGTGGAGFSIPQVRMPKVSGGGPLAGMVSKILEGAVKGTNDKLNKLFPAVSAGVTGQVAAAVIPPGAGTVVGASEFGPPGVDPTVHDNAGAYAPDVPGSIARLQSGGNWWNILQPMSQVRLTASTGKSIVATVTDAGSGGGSVGGYPRAVDLWWQTANMLGLPGDTAQWSGLLRVSSAGSLPGAHGLGHARGGMVDYAGRFGGGGAVTATHPTMAMFGDNGPETAIFVPHAQSGGMYEAGMAHAPYTAKPPGAIGQTSSGTWYKGSGSNRVYWEKNFKTGQYQWMTGGQLDHAQGRHGHSSPSSSSSSSATPHKAPKDFETDPLRFGRDPYGHVRLPRAQLSALGFPFDAHRGDPLQLQGEALADLTKKGFGDVVHALVHFFDHEGPRALASDIRHITRHTRHLALHTEELKSDVFTVKHILHSDHLSHRRREHLQHVLHEDLQRLHIDNKEIRRGREMAAAAMNVEFGKYAREFNQQSAAASNMSNLESALGGLTAGTPISDVGLRNPAVLRALGLLPKTGKVTDKMIDRAVRIAKSLRGTTPQAYEQQADYLQHTELPEYARDQRHLERLYRQALRDHNRTVAKKVLGELRTVTDARIQAETDLQTAQVNQINAIYQAAQTKAGNQQGATDLVSAITSLSPGAVLAKMGITSKVLKSIGIDPAMANIGTSVSYFQNLESQQGGHLTADQVAAAHQAVRNQNLLLQGQMRTDERTLKNLEARLPGLTGSAKTAAQTAIEGLVNSIVQLEGTMQGNTQALKQLTTATNANTTATGQMTGQVAYSYNSQEYLASDNGFNVGQV